MSIKKFLVICGFIIFFMNKAIALQNNSSVDPVEYFQQIAEQVQSYKYQIQHCYVITKDFSQCNGGMNGIDPNINAPSGNIASLRTTAGIITVLPVPVDIILPTDSYILTPSVSSRTFSWTASGISVDKGYINF